MSVKTMNNMLNDDDFYKQILEKFLGITILDKKELLCILNENDDFDKDDNEEDITNINEFFKRKFKKRIKICKQYDLNNYTKYLEKEVNSIKTQLGSIVKDNEFDSYIKKHYKITERRLIKYGKFCDSSIESDDLFIIRKLINNTKVNSESKISNFFCNISLTMFNIYSLLDIFFTNYIKIIYVDSIDEFRFYVLDKIENRTVYWNLDCRLENTIHDLMNDIIIYSINLFRSIYYEFFRDNNYRENYKEYNNVFEKECSQLLDNLNSICMEKTFYVNFISTVKENCIYEPTTTDVFNLSTDDKLQKEQFENLKDNPNKFQEINQKLFDNFT